METKLALVAGATLVLVARTGSNVLCCDMLTIPIPLKTGRALSKCDTRAGVGLGNNPVIAFI